VLVIEDNLCNNYCNISLNSTCRDFLYMWTFSHMQREGKNIHRGAIFQKRRNTKIPKDKKPKPVSLPWLQPLLKKKKKLAATLSPLLALAKQTRETTQIRRYQRNSPHLNRSSSPSIFPTAAGGHNTHFLAPALPAKRSRSPSPDFSLSQLLHPTDSRLISLLPTFPTHSPVQ